MGTMGTMLPIGAVSLLGFICLFGCSSSSSGDNNNCSSVAGRYSLTNQCPPPVTNDPCTVTQTTCSLAISCTTSGSLNATISGNQISFSPQDGVTCNASIVEGGAWSGTCTGGCSFNATKQ